MILRPRLGPGRENLSLPNHDCRALTGHQVHALQEQHSAAVVVSDREHPSKL